ncbi:MAG: double-strand break repair helicase AddA [Afipia sp.]|nr:double-strand break repair helicase AddA [Afipia sp.]
MVCSRRQRRRQSVSELRTNIPEAVRNAQAKASHPATSAFVAANAGSGKTHVLVNRVIRLLLRGTSPEKILCITFTKAAAANMAEKVFEKLGRWVTLTDDALDEEIRDLGETKPGPLTRGRVRELFACALETPGGLKVQTIHALCTRLLQQFPFEAKVPAHFAVLDERDQDDMMERANLAVLMEASRDPTSAEARALDVAMASAADVTFRDVVREACFSRQHFAAWADGTESIDAAIAQAALALGIGVQDRAEDVEQEIVDGPNLPESEWPGAAGKFDLGGENDKKQSKRIRVASLLSGKEQVDAYLGVFLTDEMEARASLATKKVRDVYPDFIALLEREQNRVLALLEKRRAINQRDRTRALLTIAKAVSDNYRREKRERGLLDYDDLIDKTLDLLNDGASGWVHFKLDRGIDHVLIDEAQDTSPRQWDIVEHLIEEFAAGAGARDGVKRTIFAVGDEKQSIFSFQGAAPREFDLRRRELASRFAKADLAFESVSLKHSFRSGRAILDAVDQVFREEAIYPSIHAADNGRPVHNALIDAPPAVIDLWPLEEAAESENEGGWAAPFDAIPESSPEAILARRVQVEISSLVMQGAATGVGKKRRPISYGDVLVLVRRRGTAFDAVIQALKRSGIPVAGADRLNLTEHIAVIDLMNLADALLLPADDLALAVALKSPLFGLDDDDLLKFAPLRKGTLRDALADGATKDSKLKAAHDRLVFCEHRFASESPFAFYSWLLGGDGGRARTIKRLGPEANDALDEFLELALTFEKRAPASLQGFMAWLRAAETEVKRDMEIRRDEVRVMTVHGAKGLEASVVFLIDTTTSPADTQRQNLIRIPRGNAGPHASNVVIWAGKKADDAVPVAAARAQMKDEIEHEYRRLLYVAMTRAADRLIVGGVLPGNHRSVRKLSWYDLIAKGLERSELTSQTIKSDLGPFVRYSRRGDAEPGVAESFSSPAAKPEPPPAWLRARASPERPSVVLLRPSESSLDDAHPVISKEAPAARTRALQRGTLVHRLLQSLPDVQSARRTEAATRFMVSNAGGWSESDRAALINQVLSIIDDKKFATLFTSDSRAEVSIVGRIQLRDGQTALVSGQIDRLAVTNDDVFIVDYKTNHAPPSSVADAPQAYVRKLALYRDVLRRLYPDKSIRCALLWTETAAMMEIPTTALDAELQSVIG